MRQRSAVRRLSHVIVAALIAGAATGVYRSSLFLRFDPIRVGIIDSDRYSLHHVVSADLPDLSRLRDHAAILALTLDNPLSEQIRIALFLEGRLTERFTVRGDSSVSRDVVVSPEVVGILANRRGANQSVEVTGDADGWAVTGLEIRNYRARLGSAPLTVVVPATEQGFRSRGFTSAAIATTFCFLSFFLVGRQNRGATRAIGNAIAMAVFLVYLICLILPRVSAYKILLSRGTFWALALALFSPVLLETATALLRSPSWHRVVAGHWARHETTFQRGAALLGLTAAAVAQPVFGVVSNSPEFFAARGTAASTALAAVSAISVGLPLALLALERAIRIVSRRAATAFFSIVIAALGAAVVLPWIVRQQVAASFAVTLGALTGTLLVVGYARSRIVRLFLTALAPATMIVPAIFLLDPDVRQSFVHGHSAPVVQRMERKPPIVFVIFDELPLNSLLTADRQIDAGRYPNFAALARDAYWFRNATTVSYTTSYAVPAVLSGRYPTAKGAVPTLEYYPVNLFTALAGHYEIFSSLKFNLCPPGACHSSSAHEDTIGLLLSDLGLVWLHVVLPRALAEGLPPVTDDWADFGGAHQAAGLPDGRGGIFAQFVAAIDRQPARLYFIHSMLPHTALEYVPSGHRYRAPYGQTREGRGQAYAEAAQQRHLAQVGFVDRLLGDLLSHLRKVNVYDHALVIVTSDHGASYLDDEPKRVPRRHNLADILQVPLLVKVPHQQRGEVLDQPVETIDILPTVFDVVGAEAAVNFDGRSLLGSHETAHPFHTYIRRSQSTVEARVVEDLSADQSRSLRIKERRFGRGDGAGLYAAGGARSLLGTTPDTERLRAPRGVKITIRNLRQFAGVSLDRVRLPLYVDGLVESSKPPPVTVAVIVNGIIAAVAHSYAERSAHVFSTLIPETCLRNGDNTVEAIAIDEAGGEQRRP